MRSFERAPIAVQLKRIGDATEKLHVACKLYHFRAFRLFKGLIKPLACFTILSQHASRHLSGALGGGKWHAESTCERRGLGAQVPQVVAESRLLPAVRGHAHGVET